MSTVNVSHANLSKLLTALVRPANLLRDPERTAAILAERMRAAIEGSDATISTTGAEDRELQLALEAAGLGTLA